MVKDVCNRLDLDINKLLFVWASPPCNTYSKLGPVNEGRGTHSRLYTNPEWPPRNDNTVYAQRARHDDTMTEGLTQSLMEANRSHGVHFAMENPSGGMSRRPFMQTPQWLSATSKMTVDYVPYI